MGSTLFAWTTRLTTEDGDYQMLANEKSAFRFVALSLLGLPALIAASGLIAS